MGVGGRRRHRARPHTGADRPLPRGLGRVHRARIRHADTRIRRRRVRTGRGQVADRLGRPGFRAGGHRLRRRLPHRVRLSASGKAVATGHSTGRRGDRLRGRPLRRSRLRIGGSDARLRAHLSGASARLLERRGLRVAGPGTDSHRRAHRRGRVDTPRVVVDRAAHRLVYRQRDLHRRFAAGGRLRRIPCRHSGIAGDIRARRAHRPESLRVDEGPPDDRHAGRRGQPRRGRHPGPVATRAGRGHPGRDQHRRGRRRRHRRRVLPRFQRVRHAFTAHARRR